MTKVAFLGLGVMGYHMAGYLAKAGYDTTVYNRTVAKAQKWCDEFGGKLAETPAQAVASAQFAMACVGNDDDLRQVTLGENGAFGSMAGGAVFVDHTTASATVARELYQAAVDKGFHFLDAPVSGGEAGAQNGALTVMVGGDQPVFDRAKPVIDSYSQRVALIGTAGSGQYAKMVNQICIAGLVQGLSEGMNFGASVGLDMEKVVSVISKGAAQSWQMDNRAATMLKDEFEFGFAVDWMRKDLGMCFDEAEKLDIDLPVTRIVDGFYAEIQAMGGNRWDTSSLMRRLTR